MTVIRGLRLAVAAVLARIVWSWPVGTRTTHTAWLLPSSMPSLLAIVPRNQWHSMAHVRNGCPSWSGRRHRLTFWEEKLGATSPNQAESLVFVDPARIEQSSNRLTGLVSRRRWMAATTYGAAALMVQPRAAMSASTVPTNPSDSAGTAIASINYDAVVNVERWISHFLSDIPTFTIVDKEGVPFMVVGDDAKVTAYLFTSYSEAQRLLGLASDSTERALREQRRGARRPPTTLDSDSASEIVATQIPSNPWKLARISTVPLETAVSLALKTASTKGNYFRLAPAAQDVDDALALTQQTDLAEGKVPLFYYETTNNSTNSTTTTTTTSPLYFQKQQLKMDFQRAHPKDPLPTIQVTELFAIVAAVAATSGGGGLKDDDDYSTLTLVAPVQSAARAAECRRRSGSAPPLVLGKRNLIL
jgi:hypothetical protein